MTRDSHTPSRPLRLGAAALVAALFLVTDQVSKHFVIELLHTGAFPLTVIPGVIEFDFVANTGVSFGLAQGFGSVFVLLAAVIVAVVVAYLARARVVSWFEVVGLGMLVGGAVGNALDRALLGFVIDFIATTFIDFPVFNIADIGITVGVALAFVGYLWFNPASHEKDVAGDLASEDEEGEGDAHAV